ncbi:MAG: protein phosphatase 2C domain-containing protein [Bowdeniella nasicola]|nr:protein phosphatase 2C domain-containing protein [Bowdeniella nasicola]
MSIQFNYAARSDVGMVRSINQDSAYAGPHLLVLADGMGGPAGGDIASSVAVAHLALLDGDTPSADDLIDLLMEAIDDAHSELMARTHSANELRGMGTTCIAVLRSGAKLAMVHIGDSRAYMLRDGRLHQLTTDHTYVQHLVDTGQITPEEAEHHPMRHMILRALGDSAEQVQVDTSVREARPRDRWLLSSDGLFGVVSAETITETLENVADVGECADTLITLALRAGAPDNVTVIVCDMVDTNEIRGGSHPATAPQIVGAAATDRLEKTRTSAPTSAAAKAANLRKTPPPRADEESDQPVGKRRKVLPRLAGLIVILAILVGAVSAAYSWTRSQYYVAAHNGYVTIYQGIPQSLGSWKLSHVHHQTNIAIADLPTYAQERLEVPTTRSSLEEAEDVVANFRSLTDQAKFTNSPADPAASDDESQTPSTPSPSTSTGGG